MTTKEDLQRIFPMSKQEGGNHYRKHKIHLVDYKDKNGIEDLKKIIHYCELEIKWMKDQKDD